MPGFSPLRALEARPAAPGHNPFRRTRQTRRTRRTPAILTAVALATGLVAAPATASTSAPVTQTPVVAAASLPTVTLAEQLGTYVSAVYRDLFGRQPDPTGLATWTQQLQLGVPRSAVADAITSSAEYRSGLISGVYREYLSREADPSGLGNWLGAMAGGMTIQSMESGFVASAEYFMRGGSSPEGWVSLLYADVLGRGAGANEVAHWTGLLAAGAGRDAVASGFLYSTEHLTTVVDAVYRQILGRSIDPTGRSTWVAAIQRGARFEAVVGSIVASDEYFLRNVGSLPVAPAGPTLSGDRLSNGCALTTRGIPTCGTVLGAAVGANDDPTSFERQVGGGLGVRRTFFQPSQVDGAVRMAQADAAAGRISWMSFKVPYSWSEMAAGKGDAWVRDLTARLDAVDGTIWLAFHHEPEKDGAVGDWVAMQRRLSPIVRTTSSDIGFSIILTGWNQFYGPAEYRMENMWPGDGLVDIIGFDIYNQYGVVKDGAMTTKVTDLGSQYFEQIRAFSRAHGNVAWGLAETGYTNEAAAADPGWLARSYDQMAAAGGVAFSYFNTTLNSVAYWPLDASGKITQYAGVLARAPRLG